ncbi:MAG: hypothetical protein LUC83_00520 [Clostridiales bacterium]|nr:hypothetical protein [Clostridiales bacterium]
MKNRKFRVVAFLLAIILVFSAAPLSGINVQAANADESGTSDDDVDADSEENDSGSISVTYINPLYEDVIDESDLVSAAESASASSDTYSGRARTLFASASYSDVDSAGAYLRQKMTARTETVTFTYTYTPSSTTDKEIQSEIKALYNEIFSVAVEHTGEPTEGDYLKWQYGGYSGNLTYTSSKGVYAITVPYTITYYTTAAQEEEVDEAVDALLTKLKVSTMEDDYDVIEAVYDYICANITYDNDNLYDDSYVLKFTTYAALIDGTAVCQGYATLFYRLMLECGIDARLVPNDSHGWNIVQLADGEDDYYYYVDCTWDAGKTTYDYFLKGSADFSNHTMTTATKAVTGLYDIAKHRTAVTKKAVAATCTTSGLTAEKTCVDCGTVVQEQEVVAAMGHSYSKSVTEATYTTKGKITYTCSVCGNVKTESTGYLEGLAKTSTSKLAYYKNGSVYTSYTGYAQYEKDGTWYYVKNGYVSTSTNSVIKDVNSEDESVIDGNSSWWYVVGGVVQTDFTGLAD